MKSVKGTGGRNIPALTCNRALICFWKERKYLIKFQTFCQIKSSDRNAFAKAGTVSMKIRKMIFRIKSGCFQLRLQNSGCFSCLFFRSHDHGSSFKLIFSQPKLLLDLFQAIFQSLPEFPENTFSSTGSPCRSNRSISVIPAR